MIFIETCRIQRNLEASDHFGRGGHRIEIGEIARDRRCTWADLAKLIAQEGGKPLTDHTAFRTDWMPFAGRRHSGYGVGGIPWSMQTMSQEKMLVLRQDE